MYRNNPTVKRKNGLFRNVYNRQSAGKGVREAWGVREGRVVGTLLLAGEEFPDDDGLLSRCVTVFIPKTRLKDPYDWFLQNKSKLSAWTAYVLSHYEEAAARFIDFLDSAKDRLIQLGADTRFAINYAVCYAGYLSIYKEDENKLDLIKLMEKKALERKVAEDEENLLARFFNDLEVLRTQGKVPEEFIDVGTDKVTFYFAGLYQIWAKEYRQIHGEVAFSFKTIKEYLSEEVRFTEIRKYIKGSRVKMLVIKKELLQRKSPQLWEFFENELI